MLCKYPQKLWELNETKVWVKITITIKNYNQAHSKLFSQNTYDTLTVKCFAANVSVTTELCYY